MISEETKKKISETLKSKGIRPKVIFDWTGIKRGKSPLRNRKRPAEVGKKISEVKKGHLVSKEAREKISKTLEGRFTGENSPVWIQDRSNVKKQDNRRDDSDYKIWRQSVYRRDNWKCKINDGVCKGRIEAHHIFAWKTNPELRYEVNNGITLCHFHHPRSVEKQNSLKSYFIKLLED